MTAVFSPQTVCPLQAPSRDLGLLLQPDWPKSSNIAFRRDSYRKYKRGTFPELGRSFGAMWPTCNTEEEIRARDFGGDAISNAQSISSTSETDSLETRSF
jgi:hypothetical protein